MRWEPIVRTSPSGKTLFVCLVCGRVSQTPDKACPPFENWTPDGRVLVRCGENPRALVQGTCSPNDEGSV
jgi:hypothetical protein